MTAEERVASWADDRARGIFHLRHFMYCYVHPENLQVLLLGVRLNAALSTDGAAVHFHCPMLSLDWSGPIGSADADFRPTIAAELLRGVGVKRDEALETYKLCPFSLVLARKDFITCHANDMSLDLDGVYWLPQVTGQWKQYLRAA
jgi:hypothetical protein